ncbi:MAG TPA: hypothetical protein VJN88_10925 [Ktedonobacterales bacterium]|nr:hypothetical protein [Ktedonobacterales bacterium]
MSAIQDVSTVVGLASGVVGLVSGGFGLYDRLHKNAKRSAPVAAGRYPPAPLAQAPAARRPAPGLPESLPNVPKSAGQRLGQGNPPPPRDWAHPGQFYAPAPAAAPAPLQRRWLTHPGILLGTALVFILYALAGQITTAPPTSGVRPITGAVAVTLVILALGLYIATVVVAARQASRLHRFGWMFSIVVILGYGVLCFGLFGPTTRPAHAKSVATPPARSR